MINVDVKLFANLRQYLPPDSDGKSVMLELAPGTPIDTVIQQFGIPLQLAQLVMIDGQHVTDYTTPLNESCILSVFPAIAGG